MIETSQEFIDAMREKTLTTSAKIEVIDNRHNNGIMIEKGNYAIFEGDGISLDGSECTITEINVSDNTPTVWISTEESILEGWYSNDLSDKDGNIDTNTYSKVVNHNKKTISNLHVLFSNVREEYAVDFSIDINGNKTIYTDNKENEIIIENVTTGSTVTILITKWSKAYSRAKILNVYLGTVFQYEDDEIISISCKKGVDLINEEIESKEIEIKLVDENNTYNIFDEESELTSLDNDARIIVHIGVLIGNFIYYVKIDECYFKKIEKLDNELEMIITGVGIISKYQETEWEKLFDEVLWVKWTLEQITNKIGYGVKENDYSSLKERIEIYPEIKEESQKMYSCSEKSKCIHEYFNELAINCRSNLIETYDNKIRFTRIKENKPVARINIENMEEYPHIEKQDNRYNIVIKKYDYSISDGVEEVYYGKFSISQYGDASVNPYRNVEFLNANDYEFVLNIYNQDGTIYQKDITSESGQTFTIGVLPNKIIFIPSTGLEDKVYELTMKCKTLQFSNSDYKIGNFTTNESEKTIDVRSIQDDTTAKMIGKWLTDNMNKRYKYKIKANDACTYELGDTVEIETGVYKNDEMIIKTAIVVGIEYEYNGALDYYLVLKGA